MAKKKPKLSEVLETPHRWVILARDPATHVEAAKEYMALHNGATLVEAVRKINIERFRYEQKILNQHQRYKGKR